MTGGGGEARIWEEPHLGGYPDPSWLALPGLERMKLGREGGRVPFPPMSYLVEMGFTEVSRGSAAFTIPASPWFANSAGVIPGGMLAVLADAPLGASVHSELPPGVTFTTAEISMTFLRPVRPDPEAVISGGGQVIHSGRSIALSEAFMINEATDELVAHGTSRCSVFPPVDPLPEPPEDPPVLEQPRPGDSPEHPLRRPLRGEPAPQEDFERLSGLEFLRAQLSGELSPPPIHYLTGVRLVEAEEGRASHVLPCSPWLSTGFRTVQGGFTAMLAELTLSGAAFTTAEPGMAIAPLDLKVNFLRPVLPDMRDLTAEAEVIHRGRSISVASCRVTNADGKPVALATGSSMYLPGRPASLIGVEQLGSSNADEAGA
jgi:uncharacterized protein (TIGR00369 family)